MRGAIGGVPSRKKFQGKKKKENLLLMGWMSGAELFESSGVKILTIGKQLANGKLHFVLTCLGFSFRGQNLGSCHVLFFTCSNVF